MSCPITLLDGPFTMVNQGYNQALEWAGYQLELTYEAMEDLRLYVPPQLSTNVAFNMNTGWWDYIRPDKPDRPDLEFNPDDDLVVAPPTTNLAPISFTAPPVFNTPAPSIPQRVGPGALTAVEPGDGPAITNPEIPQPDAIVLPPDPMLREIVLPDVPVVNIQSFQGVRPDFTGLNAPLNTFTFTPEQYQSALLDKTRNRVSVMLDGGTGLPSAVAQALRDRAYASADIQQSRDIQSAMEAFGARGWDEPNGDLNRRVSEIIQNGANVRGATNRDIKIEEEKEALVNLRFAVEKGISVESTMMTAHMEYMRLSLDSARIAVEIDVNIFNATVALANLQLSAYQTDAQVHRDLIQAEIAKIEVYRAQLEGQRLIGELNQQDVAIYETRVRVVQAQVDIFNARVAGARAQIEANNSLIEQHRTRIQAYAERVKAYGIEWDAFKTQVEADTASMRNYEIAANVFATRVAAWDRTGQNQIAQQRLLIDEKKLDLDAWIAQLTRIEKMFTLELARLEAETRVYVADVTAYQAEAGVETVASETKERLFRVGLEQEKERATTALENVRSIRQQLTDNSQMILGAKQAIAQVSGSLASSSMSAVSFSAGVTSGQSSSTGCDTRYLYDDLPSP